MLDLGENVSVLKLLLYISIPQSTFGLCPFRFRDMSRPHYLASCPFAAILSSKIPTIITLFARLPRSFLWRDELRSVE